MRVLCVDDSGDICEMLHVMLAREGGFESVGSMESAEGLAERVEDLGANVVLLDLSMPGPDPLGAVRELKRRGSGCRVVVMSGYDDAETVGRAIAAGADGFVSKSGEPGEMVRVIRAVAGV